MSIKGKEVRVREKRNADPEIAGFNPDDAFFANRLAVPPAAKKIFKDKGLDFRFLNAAQYRAYGGHTSHWQTFKFDEADREAVGANAEGFIQRGDLILGARPKAITAQHRAFLNRKNEALSQANKTQAKELRRQIREAGASVDESEVYEGYEDSKEIRKVGRYKDISTDDPE